MAPDVNWDMIGSIAKGDSRATNEDNMEKAADVLREINEGDFHDEPEKLVILFQTAKKVLDYREKAVADILQDQDERMEDKDAEIEDLKHNLEEERKFGSGSVPRDAEFYRIENRRLLEQKESYQDQNEELNRDLNQAIEERAKFEQEAEEAKRLNKELKSENQEFRSNLREYQSIMEKQQQQKISGQGQLDVETREKLNERNKQISDLLTQITQLEEVNRGLEEAARNLKSEMEVGQEDMEKMADEYEKMRKIIGASDHFADDLHRQNAQLKMQIADLREEMKAKSEEEDTIAQAVNDKVAEWSNKLRERDQENSEQARMIGVLREKMAAVSLDQDRINVERLTKKLQERDEEIKQLQAGLNQAVGDLEEQTAIVEDLRKNKGTNRETLAYKSQIRNLQAQVQQHESAVRDAESQRAAAESDAQDNDIKLTEALKRVSLLESGQYGLTEAVNEIKECKNQIRACEREIRDLTKQTNLLEEKLNDLIEENEEYRERLGVDPRDMTDIADLRKSRDLRQQQYRAENQVLLKEIETLEDERIELKKQIRRQAQSQTQKVMQEGLHPDDMDRIDEFTEELMRRRKGGIPNTSSSVKSSLRVRPTSESRHTMSLEDLSKEVADKERKMDEAQIENRKLKQESKIVVSENDQLKVAMKDILETLKKSQETQNNKDIIRIPSLERLLHIMETKHVDHHGNGGLLKAEVDQLTGRNEELRNELRNMRREHATFAGENKSLEKQVKELQNELELITKVTENGRRVAMTMLPMPQNSDTDDVITALNEHLIQVLDKSSKDERNTSDLKESLENSRRQLQVLRHQTHLIYKEHQTEKEKWSLDRKTLEDERKKVLEKVEKNKVKVNEYERLLEALHNDPDEMKRKLGETSRKVSLLRVNEKTLIRRHKALESSEELLTSDNVRLKNEMSQIERAVSERIGYLERYKAMSVFKIESLQKALEGSIPESELTIVNRRFDEVTAKYRDLLQKENQFVAKNVKLETLQEEIKVVNDKAASLRGELAIEKEKRHTLEESMRKSSSLIPGSKSSIGVEAESVLKKVTVLEMKELNERQKAEHATRMYNQIKLSLDEMQTRNSELEHKFSQLTKLNLVAQQTERELRDELAEVVPRSVSEADRKKINNLQEELAKAKVKMSKLQDMSDISHNQLHSVQSQQQARDREMRSLRQQLREFQVQTEENALIGKLHHQILNLQASEADSQRKLELTCKNVKKLEANTLKLEKQIDEKADAVYLTRTESNNKMRQLKKTIQSLRQQFSGALPLAQQEKFSKSMIRLQEDKSLIQEELRKTRMEREKLEDRLAEANIKKQGLDELRRAIEDQRGADKLTEWSHRMDVLRLQDMKLQRQVVRQGEQIKYLENLNHQHEKTISSLEEDIVFMLKAQEEHQVEWEMREMELEKLLDQFQSQQREVSKKAKRLEDVTRTLPDPSLPVDVQLTKALEMITDQVKTMKDLQGQIKALQYENDRLKDVRHTLEGDITNRDRIINELRLHMPTSVTTVTSNMDTESKQQLLVAMDTIETLKKRISAKEESLTRYKKLLDESKKDFESATSHHERELLIMQQKIHGKTDDAFNKFKKATTGAASPMRSGVLSSNEMAHLKELEDMVKEQDAAMTALMDRVRAANADVAKQKKIIIDTRRQSESEKNKLIEDHESTTNIIRLKLGKKHRKVEELEKERAHLKDEVEKQKEANVRAPSTTMKNLVARLKVQLEEKEKQQQKLSHALTELRGDLVNQAQENIRAHIAEDNDAHSVKHLVEKRTVQYKIQIEELKDKIAELQRGMKQAKKTEETLRGELKKVLEEVEKKDQNAKKLKLEHKTKESEIIQLKDKIKRLIKTRGADAGLKFVEEKPVKLPAESSTSSDDLEIKDKVVEEVVVAVDAEAEQVLRPSSARSKLPRARTNSLVDAELINKLKSEISLLKEENDNLKLKLKKKTEEPTKSTIEIAKWDVKKQWQAKVENLKNKLQEKDKLIQVAEKQSAGLRETISRLERDKLRRSAAPIGPPIHAHGTREESVPPSDHAIRQHLHNIEELSHRLHQVGEENSELRKLNVLPRNKFAAEMDEKNKHLSEKLEELQKELLSAGLRQDRDVTLADQFQGRENHLQGRILKLSSDNTQLMFEIEQIKLDVPRLQERVEYQQNYIDLLKSEKREALARLEKLKGQQQKKPLGSSGKSVVELEKTVALMKKVVERVQRENDQLKRAPGVVSNQILDELRSENQILKNRINEMTQQIGGQLSMRYESKTQSVDRLMKENERLRKDVDKFAATRDKIRESKMTLQAEKEKLAKEMEEMKKKLTVAESKNPKIAGSGSKGYNSAVTSRMLESKLKKTEDELEKKTSQFEAMKLMLEETSSSERDLREDNERLHEQIEILERFPPGAGGSDPNTVRELQIARLTVARLESEKDELRHQAELLRKRMGDNDVTMPKTSKESGSDVTIRSENLRLETELRVMREERGKLDADARRMREELSHFDGDFFDEIEDLKYNYAECMKRNVLYEEQLRSLSRQFGVAVDIPSNDD